MKIYQIHETGGQWEDYYDYIVSSYLSKEKAYAEKERLEKEEMERRILEEKCSNCPLYAYNEKYNESTVSMYCDRYEPFDLEKHNTEEYYEELDDDCVNWVSWHEDNSYRIEEVEVIE